MWFNTDSRFKEKKVTNNKCCVALKQRCQIAIIAQRSTLMCLYLLSVCVCDGLVAQKPLFSCVSELQLVLFALHMTVPELLQYNRLQMKKMCHISLNITNTIPQQFLTILQGEEFSWSHLYALVQPAIVHFCVIYVIFTQINVNKSIK